MPRSETASTAAKKLAKEGFQLDPAYDPMSGFTPETARQSLGLEIGAGHVRERRAQQVLQQELASIQPLRRK